jgi:hypothetical protein
MFKHTSQIYLLINEYKALHMVLYDLNTKYVIKITFVLNFKFFSKILFNWHMSTSYYC